MGYITWSWWWVLCPLWLGLVLFLGVVVLAMIITFIGNRK
jgi:hypothetical protein